MAINPIPSIGVQSIGAPSVGGPTSLGPAGKAAQADNAVEGFQNLLADALGKLQGSQAQANDAVSRMAAGEPLDIHEVALLVEENSLNFQLGLQVRNKLVEAYQEVMRMQV